MDDYADAKWQSKLSGQPLSARNRSFAQNERRGSFSAFDYKEIYSSSLNPQKLAHLRTMIGSEKCLRENALRTLVSKDLDQSEISQNFDPKESPDLKLNLEAEFVEEEKKETVFSLKPF